MVTEKKNYNSPWMRYRLGTALIWLGVLTWVPFIILRVVGETPLLFWYLPFHLIGVIGGSRLRASARKEMEMPPAKSSVWQILGRALIFSGIFVWAPYFYLKLVTGQDVEVMNYLPFHLTGVLGGIALLAAGQIIKQKNNNRS
jgi:hypothetical protein